MFTNFAYEFNNNFFEIIHGQMLQSFSIFGFTNFFKSNLNLKFWNYYKTFKLQRAICHFNMEKWRKGYQAVKFCIMMIYHNLSICLMCIFYSHASSLARLLSVWKTLTYHQYKHFPSIPLVHVDYGRKRHALHDDNENESKCSHCKPINMM